MEANQLRLGNWVEYKGKLYQTTSIEENNVSISLTVFSVDNKFIKPILLTEEILLKCGFNKNKIGGYIMYTELGSMLCIYKDGSFRSNEKYIDTKIKYLHQLQNLYFSLTNKELEINLYN